MERVEPINGPVFRNVGGESRRAFWIAVLLTALFALFPGLPRITLFTSLEGYLAAHQIVETFATVVAALVFGVVWNAHKHARPGNMSILAAGLLGVAVLNIGHTLSYAGMPAFITPSGPEKAIAFWLSQRLLMVVCLIVAALRPWHPFTDARSHAWTLAGALAWVALSYWCILFQPQALPRTFIPGEGLTTFKVVVEIVLNLLFLVSALVLWRRGRDWLGAASWVLGLGGLYFALYANPFDIYNQLGHAYVVIAYVLLYQGLFISTVHEPFEKIRETSQLLARTNEELRRAYDEMEMRVIARTEELQQENVERQYAEESLRTTLLTLQEHEAELEAAKEEAVRANRAKSDFLSSMSHELRTPLNAVLGFAQLLRTGRPGPINEKQASQLDYIIQGGNHLMQLIGEILDLARIEAGNLALSIEKIEAGPLLNECLEMARSCAEKSGITVEDWQIAQPATLLVDYTRFKQVLLNLTSNAIKYSRPDGRVRLSMGPAGDGMARISVSDTGPGIAVEKQPYLFEPFNRLGAEASGVEGTGIGLSITKKLAEAMGGRIGFDSRPGEGSTFWVEVPTAIPERPRAPSRTMPPLALEMANGNGRRLLYVDDNPANVRLMADLIAEIPDWELIAADNAALGLELAATILPNIIILDINMPGLNGMEAVRQLKEMPETHAIPVIALSAAVSERAMRKGLEAGFVRYLAKPLNIATFVDTLGALQPSAETVS